MAFTYDPQTDLGKLRLKIGDSAENEGPRPGGRNFSDAELTVIMTEEATFEEAIAYVFEVLASEWSSQPDRVTVGPRTESFSDVVSNFTQKAETLRAEAGSTTGVGFAVPMERTDAYADAAEE